MRTLGKYELIRRLSSAGMAEIYLGRQVGPVGFEKTVAIKRLHPHLTKRPELVRMFLGEARVAARLSHPNIGQIYELGHDNDEYFIAMEYIHGRRLSDVQEETEQASTRVPFGLVAHVVACVCRAMHHAHTLRDELGNLFGLVHGDVSPESVLIAFNGDVKLTDFGVAKATTLAAETQTGILKGKFGYMSPEQCRNEEADHRSDIFAAGILLFELTCGQRLFVRDTDFATVQAVIKGVIPPPSAVVDDVPDELEEIIMASLARERDARYQSAQEMQLALEAAIRANGWRTGPLALSRYVTEMFADRMTPSTALPRVALGAPKDKSPAPAATKEAVRGRSGRIARRRRPGAAARGQRDESSNDSDWRKRPTASVAAMTPVGVAPADPDDQTLADSPSGAHGLQSSESAVPLQDEVQTIDVPRGSRPMPGLEGSRASGGEPPFPPLWAPDGAPATSHESPPQGGAHGGLPSVSEDVDPIMPDESMEGPTIIQPPDFHDVVLGSGTQEPAADYWDIAADSYPSTEPTPLAQDVDFAPIDESSASQSQVASSRRGWLFWLTAVLLILLAGVGTAIGLLLSKRSTARSGTLVSVTSTPPGATVYINGKEFPRPTPIVLKEITPGRRHWLVVTRDGYRTATRRFFVKKAEHLKIEIALKPGKASETAAVEVEVSPAGATVYLDGTKRGLAPIKLEQLRTSTDHTLVIRKRGYQDRSVQLDKLEAGERRSISLKLEKAPVAAPRERRADAGPPVVVPQGKTGQAIEDPR